MGSPVSGFRLYHLLVVQTLHCVARVGCSRHLWGDSSQLNCQGLPSVHTGSCASIHAASVHSVCLELGTCQVVVPHNLRSWFQGVCSWNQTVCISNVS